MQLIDKCCKTDERGEFVMCFFYVLLRKIYIAYLKLHAWTAVGFKSWFDISKYQSNKLVPIVAQKFKLSLFKL